MTGWRRALAHLAHQATARAEEQFDALRHRMRKRLGRIDPVLIHPYRGFGTEEELWLKGRVLEDKGLQEADDRDTLWQNLIASYRRFESDELPGVRLRARFQEAEQEVITDEEGYFEVHLQPTGDLRADTLWHKIDLELLDEVVPDQGPVRATGQVLVPPAESTFGIISDVDDTILQTHATSLLQMARLTFLENAHSRLPFKGVAAFYRALHQGVGGDRQNPLFFVSSSPWNLYDLLVDFCDIQGIPQAPFLLRDLGLDRETFIKSSHQAHKLAQVERILDMYPDLSFVLIGDSGQHDPEIYQEVVQAYPGRIQAIYIRDVSLDARVAEVHQVADAVRAGGVEMLLAADSAEAATHAAAHGLIMPDALTDIQAEKAKDEAPPDEVEQAATTE